MNEEQLLKLLETKCREFGQGAVARMLDYSPTAVSQVLNNKYKGGLDAFLTRVEEVFGQTMVDCPILGEIALGKCAENRKRPFASTNPLRVRLFRECQICKINSGQAHGGDSK